MESGGDESKLEEKEKLIESFKEEPKSEGKHEKGYLRTLKGIIGTFVSVIMAAMSVTTVQLLERRIPDLELNTYRFAVPLVACSASLLVKKVNPCMSRLDMRQTLVYCFASFVGSFFYYVSVTLLPAATSSCIMYTTTLLGSLVLFSVFHKERISLLTVPSALMCFTGILMVLQPGFDNKASAFDKPESSQLALQIKGNTTQPTTYQTEAMLENVQEANGSTTDWKETGTQHVLNSRNNFAKLAEIIPPTSLNGQIIGYSFALVSGLGFAWVILIIKQYNFTMELIPKVLFWIYFVNALISSLLMFIFETIVLPSNWFDAAIATIHCISAACLWPIYFTTPKYISGPLFAVMCTTEVVIMLIPQYTVLSSILPGHRNWMEVVGVILVMLGCSMSSLVEMFTPKENGTNRALTQSRSSWICFSY